MPKDARTPTKFVRISAVVLFVILCIYAAVSVAGLGRFGTSVAGNVMKNYLLQGNVFAITAFAGMSVKIVMTFPLLIFLVAKLCFSYSA